MIAEKRGGSSDGEETFFSGLEIEAIDMSERGFWWSYRLNWHVDPRHLGESRCFVWSSRWKVQSLKKFIPIEVSRYKPT